MGWRISSPLVHNSQLYRFMFNSSELRFAVQACGIDDDGAKHMPGLKRSDHFNIKSMKLVRYIYRTCGWSTRLSYRIQGVAVPDQRLIAFDLTSALEIHEGRLREGVNTNVRPAEAKENNYPK